jgi:hypothetical protein
MNLSTADFRNYWTEFHETWWSYRYMFLVGPMVFRFVVKGDFQNGHHNTAKIQHCSISKIAFNLFFKPVVRAGLGDFIIVRL